LTLVWKKIFFLAMNGVDVYERRKGERKGPSLAPPGRARTCSVRERNKGRRARQRDPLHGKKKKLFGPTLEESGLVLKIVKN